MKVSEVMEHDVVLGKPGQTLREIASLMTEKDIGSIPVADEDRLVGRLTDRDIVVRAVARGIGPDGRVGEVMSDEIKYCYDDEELRDVVGQMAELQVRRLPVVNRDKRLVGIITTANIASSGDKGLSGTFMESVTRPH